MAKVALLIGVSEYGSGLNPLPSAIKGIEAMQQVLSSIEVDGFDEVKCLSNPNPPVMREAIETLFSGRTKNDFLLLFFSGYVVQDDSGKVYFATSVTCKTPRTELIRVSAVPVSFVENLLSNSLCQQAVLILDCCLGDVSLEEITESNPNTLDIKAELGGERRVILSCLTSSHKFLEPEELNHSVYSSYLIEGMETGAADLDGDGWIAVDELHQYANNKVQIVAPALKPEFHSIEEESKILLLSSPTNDSKLKYRKEVENWVVRGEISQAGRYILDKLSVTLELTLADCKEIEVNVLKPYQEYQKKLQRYRGEYANLIANSYPLDTEQRNNLNSFIQSLGLKDENVTPIEERMALKLANIFHEKDDADESNKSTSESKTNSVPLTPNIVETSPAISPTPPASEEPVEELVPNSSVTIHSPPLPPSLVVPEYNPIPALATNVVDSKTTSPAVSTFPNKFLLLIGIGSALATMTAYALSTRTPTTPPPTPAASTVIATTTSEKPSSPSPSASPESKVCTVFVNGNLRSEPAYFVDNVVESLRESLPVTGKQTKGGWIEVKMPNNKLVWAYQDIISGKARKEMDDCLTKKKIKITLIEDILPPNEVPAF